MRNFSVLVVDDEPEICDALRETLKASFQNVSCVLSGDGVDGLHKIERQQFDFVILDLGLPRMNGAAVMKSLDRLEPRLRPRHLVCLSGQEPDAITRGLMKDLQVEFIRKPCQSTDILNYIRRHVEPRTVSDHQPRTAFESSLAGAFLESTLKICTQDFQMLLQKENLSLKSTGSDSTGEVSAVVSILGLRHEGQFCLSFPAETLRALCRQHFARDLDPHADEAGQLVRDLTQKIFELTRRNLNDKGADLLPALPTVVWGLQHRVMKSASAPCVGVQFNSNMGPFHLDVATRRRAV